MVTIHFFMGCRRFVCIAHQVRSLGWPPVQVGASEPTEASLQAGPAAVWDPGPGLRGLEMRQVRISNPARR